MEVLLDARAQEALVGDEEGLVVRAAVGIGKTVVDDCVLAIVKVHLAHDGLAIRPLKRVIDPTLQREGTRWLLLGKRGDVTQGDVHLAVGGVLDHGLGQLADARHDAHVVVCATRIGIDGVDTDLDRNDRGVELIAGRRRNLLQEVCRRVLLGKVAEGPGHVCIAGKRVARARVMALVGLEDKHAAPAVDGGGMAASCIVAPTCCCLGLAVIQRELHPVDRRTVLVDLHDTQLTLLVGDVEHRTEVAHELASVKRRVAALIVRGRGRPHADGVIDQVLEFRAGEATALDGIKGNGAQAIVSLVTSHGRDLVLGHAECPGQGLLGDDSVEHAHVAIGIDVHVTVSSTGQVTQGARQALVFVIPAQMPSLSRAIRMERRLLQRRAQGQTAHYQAEQGGIGKIQVIGVSQRGETRQVIPDEWKPREARGISCLLQHGDCHHEAVFLNVRGHGIRTRYARYQTAVLPDLAVVDGARNTIDIAVETCV